MNIFIQLNDAQEVIKDFENKLRDNHFIVTEKMLQELKKEFNLEEEWIKDYSESHELPKRKLTKKEIEEIYNDRIKNESKK